MDQFVNCSSKYIHSKSSSSPVLIDVSPSSLEFLFFIGIYPSFVIGNEFLSN